MISHARQRVSIGLAAEELRPCVVAGVVDDVRRPVDLALDDPDEVRLELTEERGFVAEQARSW
jgi:hypothetical protein